VEYILYGKLSDKENLSAFRRAFYLSRIGANFAHISMCSNKQAAARKLSLAFGKAAPAMYPVILGLWIAAESENDARLLMDKQNVALVKSENTWALSLHAAVNVTEDMQLVRTEVRGYVKPQSSAGLPYEGYLRIFLATANRETKLLRILDLIQINFRLSYYGEFLIKEHYTGFTLTAKVSGKRYEYEQKY
jgi:hypothetical protein